MASQPPPGDNVPELFMQLLQVTTQLKVLIDRNPQEAIEIFRAFPVLARTFHRAVLMLLSVGLPPYLPVETDDVSDDQSVAAYSPQLLQPPLSPSPSPAPMPPPQVQPSSAPAAEPVFDAWNDLGESSSPPEEEQPPPPSQTPPKSARGEKK
ncbi:hypothetical protein DsansV1_C38g0235351 [Dioscorea sansibarensis]